MTVIPYQVQNFLFSTKKSNFNEIEKVIDSFFSTNERKWQKEPRTHLTHCWKRVYFPAFGLNTERHFLLSFENEEGRRGNV